MTLGGADDSFHRFITIPNNRPFKRYGLISRHHTFPRCLLEFWVDNLIPALSINPSPLFLFGKKKRCDPPGPGVSSFADQTIGYSKD